MGMYIHQTKYVKELLNKFKLDYCKSMSTLMHSTLVLLTLTCFFKKSNDYRLIGFYDGDYARDKIERKSTSGGCHLIRVSLVSWTSKRQGIISLSIVEVEYTIVIGCYSQILWIKHQLEDYNIYKSKFLLLCDNIVVINLSRNPILNYKAKFVEIKHHFIRDYIQKIIFDMKFISIEHQLANTIPKPLVEDKPRSYLISSWYMHLGFTLIEPRIEVKKPAGDEVEGGCETSSSGDSSSCSYPSVKRTSIQ
ncbi:Copia protein, partial [Mucuna pruriens]